MAGFEALPGFAAHVWKVVRDGTYIVCRQGRTRSEAMGMNGEAARWGPDGRTAPEDVSDNADDTEAELTTQFGSEGELCDALVRFAAANESTTMTLWFLAYQRGQKRPFHPCIIDQWPDPERMNATKSRDGYDAMRQTVDLLTDRFVKVMDHMITGNENARKAQDREIESLRSVAYYEARVQELERMLFQGASKNEMREALGSIFEKLDPNSAIGDIADLVRDVMGTSKAGPTVDVSAAADGLQDGDLPDGETFTAAAKLVTLVCVEDSDECADAAAEYVAVWFESLMSHPAGKAAMSARRERFAAAASAA